MRDRWLQYWARWLDRQPGWLVWGLSLGLLILISGVDLVSPRDVSLSILYLFPVALTSWWLGRRAGLGMALLSTLAWYGCDQVAHSYDLPWMAYWNAAVRLGFFWVVAHLLTALHRAYQREQVLARVDSLTGLYNRRHFFHLLDTELARAQRYGYPLTLAYMDMDNFKQVNDTLGHGAGDDLLRQVGQVLKAEMRRHDVVGRLGGDEFALLLPQTTLDAAQTALGRVHHQLQALSLPQGKAAPFPVGYTMGALTFLVPGGTADDLIAQVDRLMYQIKTSGKGQLVCHVWPDGARPTTPNPPGP